MHHRLVVNYQCFRTTCQSHIQGSSILMKMVTIGCPRMLVKMNLHCITSQKSGDLIYTVAEA